MGYIFENSMYFYQYNNTYYAYSFISHILIIVSKDIYDCVVNRCISKDLEMQVILWRKIGLIKEERSELLFKPQIKQAQFSFAPIHRCNLRCKYCFADHGENYKGYERKISSEMIDKILNFVFFNYYASCKEYRMDFVSGGEPLLNFKMIQYAIEKSKSLLCGTGKKLCVFLTTNGTIFDSKMIEYIDRNNINLGISIDGEKSVHDENRCYENGAGSYANVKRTISQIKNSKHLSNHTKDMWGLTVITGESKQIPDIIKHHRSIGINHMQMELVRIGKKQGYSINDTNVNKLIQEYKNLTDFFLSEINQGSFEYLKMILNDNDYYGKIVCRIIDGGRVYYRCSAGIGKLNFDAQGNIYPCEFFVGSSDYCIGNVEDGVDENKQRKFFDENVDKRIKCKNCWAKYLCGGDCYYNSLIVNENIYMPDKCFCQINKKLVEYALVVMFALKQKGLLKECANYIRVKKILSNAAGGSVNTIE